MRGHCFTTRLSNCSRQWLKSSCLWKWLSDSCECSKNNCLYENELGTGFIVL